MSDDGRARLAASVRAIARAFDAADLDHKTFTNGQVRDILLQSALEIEHGENAK